MKIIVDGGWIIDVLTFKEMIELSAIDTVVAAYER